MNYQSHLLQPGTEVAEGRRKNHELYSHLVWLLFASFLLGTKEMKENILLSFLFILLA